MTSAVPLPNEMEASALERAQRLAPIGGGLGGALGAAIGATFAGATIPTAVVAGAGAGLGALLVPAAVALGR